MLKPVVDLLGTKAYIRIRYITTVEGADATSVTSLHGPAEAHEDLGPDAREECEKPGKVLAIPFLVQCPVLPGMAEWHVPWFL